jgi:hypothetical protein
VTTGSAGRAEFADLMTESAELLPSRDALSSFLSLANITAVNVSLALNAATIGSSAMAGAGQLAYGVQY